MKLLPVGNRRREWSCGLGTGVLEFIVSALKQQQLREDKLPGTEFLSKIFALYFCFLFCFFGLVKP